MSETSAPSSAPSSEPSGSGSDGYPGRLLGIDYGGRRIGVAVSDALGITTRPLTVIDRKRVANPVAALADLVVAEEVAGVVVGLPVHDDGTPGTVAVPATALARRLVAVLAERLGAAAPPVRMHDEQSTSAEARERLRDAGKLRLAPDGRPLDRGAIDAASAAVLLERYLAEGPTMEPLSAEAPEATRDEKPPDSHPPEESSS